MKRSTPYLFIAPFFVAFALFWLYPIAHSLVLGFTDARGANIGCFVGLDNFRRMGSEPRFWVAARNTLVFTVIYVVVLLLLALGIAILLDSKRTPFRRFFRSVLFMPITISMAVVAVIFSLIYAPDIGLLNSALRLISFDQNINWLADPRFALGAVMVAKLWRAAGYYSMFFLAGLQTIPEELHEASKIDGASPVATFLYVTLPLLRPMVVFTGIMGAIWGLQLFDEPWILTGGGPAGSTLTLGIYVYEQGFRFFRFGYSAAVSYTLTTAIMIFTLLRETFSRKSW